MIWSTVYKDTPNVFSTHVCLRYTDDAKRTFKCRFNFPKPIAPVSTLKYEKKKTRNQGQQRVLCDQTRDEKEWWPSQQQPQTHATFLSWRANIDLQIVIDEKRARLYATKYFSKGESCSKHFLRLHMQWMQTYHTKYSLMKTTNHLPRNFLLLWSWNCLDNVTTHSVQETCHLLLGNDPLWSSQTWFSSESFQVIN